MRNPDCSTPPPKTCRKCGFDGPPSEFVPNGYTCLECKRAYSRAYHQANRDRLNAYCREYRATNIDHLKEKQRQYREANREKLRKIAREHYAKTAEARIAQKRVYRSLNAEKCRESVRQYHRAHRAEASALRKEWLRRNPGKQAEYQKKWDAANPETLRQLRIRGAAARRARVANAPAIEPIDRAALWERDGGRCHICGKRCDPKDWHADHLIPLSRGGPHTMDNLAVSHPVCNLRRHNSGPAQLRLM